MLCSTICPSRPSTTQIWWDSHEYIHKQLWCEQIFTGQSSSRVGLVLNSWKKAYSIVCYDSAHLTHIRNYLCKQGCRSNLRCAQHNKWDGGRLWAGQAGPGSRSSDKLLGALSHEFSSSPTRHRDTSTTSEHWLFISLSLSSDRAKMCRVNRS